MKEVETRRVVPISIITLICVGILAIFQVLILTGAYQIKTATVKKMAPWLYEPFRKLVGEHPSSRPMPMAKQGETSVPAGITGIVGITPEELSVTLENMDAPFVPLEKLEGVHPVSQPEKVKDPVDETIPVG
ncbi:MAG: hypothetical protein V5783_06495 [Pontiella sp.]